MIRKYLSAAVVLCASAAGTAQAASIACTPPEDFTVSAAAGKSAVFTCAPAQGAGAGAADDNWAGDNYIVQSIRFFLSGTFQDNNADPGTAFSVLFSTGTSSSNLFALPKLSCTASGVADAGRQTRASCPTVPNSAVTSFVPVSGGVDVIPSFTVTISGAAGSNPLPFSASSSLWYEVTATQRAVAVSEPGTLGIVALSLLGLAAASRRSRKA